MIHHNDATVSDIESATDKKPQTPAHSEHDTLSTSPKASFMERSTALPPRWAIIVALASLIPMFSFLNLCLTLLGHLLFIMFSRTGSSINDIPLSSSITAGAVGGAIWGVVSLAAIVMLHLLCRTSIQYETWSRIGAYLAVTSFIVAPAIGVAVVGAAFHGNILYPLTASVASITGAFAVCVTLALVWSILYVRPF